jgi:hypothetical protein
LGRLRRTGILEDQKGRGGCVIKMVKNHHIRDRTGGKKTFI